MNRFVYTYPLYTLYIPIFAQVFSYMAKHARNYVPHERSPKFDMDDQTERQRDSDTDIHTYRQI